MRSSLRVDPATGAMQFKVPLGAIPGRGGANLPVELNYSSKVWTIKHQSTFPCNGEPVTSYRPEFAKSSASGWTSTVGWFLSSQDLSIETYDSLQGKPAAQGVTVWRKFLRLPDGSRHEVRKDDSVHTLNENDLGMYYAVDGSRLMYDSNTGTTFLPDGSRLVGNQYIDRNGNFMTLSNGAWTDTLGRTIGIPIPGSAPSAAGDVVYTLPGGLTYTFRWRNLADVLTDPSQPLRFPGDSGSGACTLGFNIPGTLFSTLDANNKILKGSSLFNPVVLWQIGLANNTNYTFTYNVWGEINKIVYPTGGTEQFTYGGWEPLGGQLDDGTYSQANRGVYSRVVSDGVTAQQWNYGSGGFETGVDPATEARAVTGPDGTVTKTWYYKSVGASIKFGFDDARTGMVREVRVYNSTGTMLRRTINQVVRDGPLPGGHQTATRNARVTKTVNIILDTGGNALAATTEMTYDADLNVTSTKQYGFVSITQSTAQTSDHTAIPVGTLIRTTETDYLTNDPDYRARNLLSLPTAMRVKNGAGSIVAQSTITYDEPSSLPSYGTVTGWSDPQTDARGNATTTSHWLNTTSGNLQTHIEYDQCGNPRKIWDARDTSLTNPSEIEYSSTYDFAYPTKNTSADPDGSGPLSALVTESVYDKPTGLITSTKDANNQTTTFSYGDPLLRLKQVIRASNDTAAKNQTTYDYNDSARTITVTSDLTNFNDNQLKVETVFDALGRPVEKRTYEDANNYIITRSEFDVMGRAHKTSNPFLQGGTPDWTTTTFDALGRTTSVKTPDNAVVTTSYSGNTVTVADQAGKARKSVTDALGRLIEVYEDPNGVNYLTTYNYDTLDNLVKVTQASQQGTQQRFFMYDSLKRLIRARNPEQGTNASLNLSDPMTGNSAWSISYEYDSNGNLTLKTDPRGIVTGYSYDALNRIKTILYRFNGQPVPNTGDIEYLYDNATNGKGRLWLTYKWGAKPSHTAVGSYDALGRVTQFYHLFGDGQGGWSPGYEINRTYNLAGNVTSQTYPSGRTVSYSYDAAGRTSSFSGNLGGDQRTYATGVTYNLWGAIGREQFGTDTALYHKSFYNIRGQLFDTRLSSVNDEWDWNRGRLILYYSSNHIWGQSGTDNNGNVRFAETWIPPANATLDQADTLFEDSYTYDSLNRLFSVTDQKKSVAAGWENWQPQFRQQYDYDQWGNRTINAAQTWGTGINNKQFAVDTATNRLGVPSGQTGEMTYDFAGNLIKDTYTGAGAREYDAENRMTKAWGGNNQWQEYTYNADGQRTRRKVDGQETWQIYGIDGELLAEYAANGSANNPQKEYGYRSGQLLITASTVAPASGDQSLSLNGTTAYLQAPNSSSLNITGAITVEAWVKPTSIGSYQYLVSRESFSQAGTGGGYELTLNNLGKARFDLYHSPTTYTPVIGNTVLSTDTWHHVAGVWDGSFMRLYVDGVLDATVNSGNAPASGTSSLKLGRNSGGGYFSGLIDEVRVSNAAIYSSNFTPQPHLTASSSTKGLWKFDSQSTADSSGNGNNGALQGNATYSGNVPGGGGSGGAQIQWLVADHLGTPRMIVDQTGTLASVKRHDYLPFGEEIFANVGGRSTTLGYTGGDGVRQQFTEKERDVETGLDYVLARYYSAIEGRFTSPDPLDASGHTITPQSWNRYSYVLNNPLKLTDPDGEMWVYRYLNDDHTRVAISWVDGNKLTKALEAKGYHAVDFGGEESKDVTVTDGSVYRLTRDSDQAVRLRGPDPSGDGGYVNSGFVREMGRRTAPMPAATLAFAALSINGGYMLAASPVLLVDAAAFSLYSIGKMRNPDDGDAPMMGTTSTSYQEVTKGGSIRNVQTDITKAEFIKNLQGAGYKVTKSGTVTILENGNNRYVIYDVAKSTGGPSAAFSKIGQGQSLKIRMKP
ncbi:MAG TPA: LamG-like jellyroll fold domain-containing protein [Pyrinomonadaceae bacterium]|nr:LamG-like jellyroll fold domain-containing protein [Pyrinomonadaceae bacterium]